MVVSNIHDTTPLRHLPPCKSRRGALFVGSLPHLPNQQAINHLLQEVLPILKQQLPADDAAAFKLHIVGGTQDVPAAIQALLAAHREYVVFHGWLSDEMLALLYSRVKVVVAPLLSGAGVKGKVCVDSSMPGVSRCHFNMILVQHVIMHYYSEQ
jgi:glycosyltransferase involved in cell wall biosynthesis